MNLDSLDYEILSFVERQSNISRVQIKSHFKDKIESLTYRLDKLTEPIVNRNLYGVTMRPTWIKPNLLVEKDGLIQITEVGRAYLQDYKKQEALKKKLLIEDRALKIIPIIIAAIALIINIYSVFSQH